MIPDRYNTDNLYKVLQNPSLLRKELKILFRKSEDVIFRIKNGKGIDFMKEDWDNLIILDACRFDYFKDQCELDGELKSKISKGANSGEFMRGNFENKQLHDTVYITGNPTIEEIDGDIFHYYEYLDDAWDSELGTIPPEPIVDRSIEIAEQFPQKRLISHFMQPHTPYIGNTGRRLLANSTNMGWSKTGGDRKKDDIATSGVSLHKAVEEGIITENEIKQAYSEDLDIVLKYVRDLVKHLSGKTVITADHGELLFEKPHFLSKEIYGHPSRSTLGLKKVPWFVIEGERRTIKSDKPIESEKTNSETIKNRLKSLGYV